MSKQETMTAAEFVSLINVKPGAPAIARKPAKKRRTRRTVATTASQKNDAFTLCLKQKLGVDAVKELQFHPVRGWRFDYAIPEHKLAIEIDGGVWKYGRHNRAEGFLEDMKKMNAAVCLGWRVLHFTPQEQLSGYALGCIREALEWITYEKTDTSEK